MTPIEKLVEAVRSYINSELENVDYMNFQLGQLSESLSEYERTKTWQPPLPIAIPDWAEWCTIDEDGEGTWWSNDDIVTGVRTWLSIRSNNYASAGYFQIPPGTKWQDCCFQVKK